MTLTRLLAAFCLLPPFALAQATHVVDAADPTADFADIQPAVDAAGNGDVILIRGAAASNYGSFVIAGKSLTLVADQSTPGLTITGGTVEIRGLGQGQRVALRGLHVEAHPCVDGAPPTLWLHDNQGSIWIEDGDFRIFPNCLSGLPPIIPSVLVIENCVDVAIEDTVVYPFFGGSAQPTAPPGVRVSNSDVRFYRSEIFGTAGQLALPPTNGGPGLDVENSSVGFYDLDSTDPKIHGGTGGHWLFPPFQDSADGGNAVELDATSVLRHAELTPPHPIHGVLPLEPGSPGITVSPGSPGDPGEQIVTEPGALVSSVADYGGTLDFGQGPDGHLLDGEGFTLTFASTPGEAVAIMLGDSPLAFDLPTLVEQPLLVLSAQVVFPLGTTDGSGVTSASFPNGVTLAAGADALTWFAQAITLEGSVVRASGPEALVVVR